MRWSPYVGGPDTSLYVTGRFRAEPRQIGRLTIRVWRNLAGDSTIGRVTDEHLAALADAWRVYWLDFGAVPTTEISIVETAWPATRAAPGTIFGGQDLRAPDAAGTLRRELSRTWWGGVVRPEGPAAFLVREIFPSWSATLAIGDTTGADILSRARRTAGDARFREAIQSLVADSRGGPPATSRFLDLLGDEGSAELRALLR